MYPDDSLRNHFRNGYVMICSVYYNKFTVFLMRGNVESLSLITRANEITIFLFKWNLCYHYLYYQLLLNIYLTTPGQSKSSRKFFKSAVWCSTRSYRLDTALPFISPCKYCRGCVMQFGGSGSNSGKDSEAVSASRWHTEQHVACCEGIPRRD